MEKKPLARGGQGEVWLLDTEPPMVVKRALLTHDYTSYLRELRTLKELSHENIVRYYDCPTNYPEIDRDDFMLFMEYCEHGSMRDVLMDKTLVYSVATIAKWAAELFTALEYLKSVHIVHQDVKPDNLFVHGNGYDIKLGDFGIVRNLKDDVKLRGGTRGYMAPEVIKEEETSDEDAYKCDIYGAGWVVLDMVNRSAPGNQDIDRIFTDRLPHLATLMKLIMGCTKEQVAERFGVEDALAICEVMPEEFAVFDIKPEPNPHRKRIVLPFGLDGKPDRALAPFEQMQPPPAAICSFYTTGPSSVPIPLKIDPRERLLLDLIEKLGTTTAFENDEIEFANFISEDDLADPGCIHMRHILIPATNAGNFNEARKYMCNELLVLLSKRDREEQFQYAQQIEDFCASPHLLSKVGEGHPELQDRFQLLHALDAWQQGRSLNFGVQMLAETDQATLPDWEILQLLDRIIKNIEELGKLFTARLIYRIVVLGGSRYSWLHLKHIGIFLRRDCTETRIHENRFNKTKMPYFTTNEMEHLNSEQVRRALIEARTCYKRKILNQPTQAGKERHLGATHYTKAILALGRAPGSDGLLAKLSSHPEQPFPGYVFLYGIPPAHKCDGGVCEVTGGFPINAAPDVRVCYHQCSTSEQIEYIETYVLLSCALQYALRWRTCELWLCKLIAKLVSDIQAKERKWVFFFELTKLRIGGEALLFEYYLANERATFITNDFQLVYCADPVKFMALVPMRLKDILPVLLGMLDLYKEYKRTKGGGLATIDEVAHTRKMEGLIDNFWRRIKKAQPQIRPSFLLPWTRLRNHFRNEITLHSLFG